MATKTIADYLTVSAQSTDLLLMERGGAYFSVTPASIATFYNAASQNSGIAFAINLASQGTNGANQALSLASQGTNLAAFGGTIAGNLTVTGSAVVDGWGTVKGNVVTANVQVGVGTVPTSAASFGTIYYDFTGPAYQQTTVDQTIFVSGSNPYPGREIAIVLIAPQSGTQAVSFSPNIKWYGNSPPTSIGPTNVLVALTSLTSSMSGVIGAVSTATS